MQVAEQFSVSLLLENVVYVVSHVDLPINVALRQVAEFPYCSFTVVVPKLENGNEVLVNLA